jgi:hypothetical protein
MLLLAHIWSYTLDHMEAELEKPTEPAQVEALTNLALDQGKSQRIQPYP